LVLCAALIQVRYCAISTTVSTTIQPGGLVLVFTVPMIPTTTAKSDALRISLSKVGKEIDNEEAKYTMYVVATLLQ